MTCYTCYLLDLTECLDIKNCEKMNSIASFRLCTLTDEELLQKIDSLCDKMYKTGKLPDRHIPARPDDDFDLLLGELLVRYNEKIKPPTK